MVFGHVERQWVFSIIVLCNIILSLTVSLLVSPIAMRCHFDKRDFNAQCSLDLCAWNLLIDFCSWQKVHPLVPGGTPLYKPYRYVPPQRVGFLRRFVLKSGIDLPILVWNRLWFSRELREYMYLSFQFQMTRERKKNKQVRNEFWEIFFVAVLIYK